VTRLSRALRVPGPQTRLPSRARACPECINPAILGADYYVARRQGRR